jgi:hypothetical protein
MLRVDARFVQPPDLPVPATNDRGRWPDVESARYYADAMRQDNLRGGWRAAND